MVNVRDLMSEIAMLQIFLVLGVLIIVGARRRWRFLVNPPGSWSWFYSQAFLKKVFGVNGTIVLCYLGGTICLIITSILIVQRLIPLGKALGYW